MSEGDLYRPNEAPGDDAEAEKADSGSVHIEASASVLTTSLNIISNVVGGGILSMPMAFAEMSVVPGMLVLLLMGIVSSYSMMLLTLCATRARVFTYKELLQVSFRSPRVARALDALIAAYTFGILVGFARIVADSMPDVSKDFLKASGVVTTGWFWILCASAIFFPLSSLKQLSELKVSSALGFLSILYVIAVVVVRFLDGSYEAPENRDGIVADDTPWFVFRPTFLAAVPLCSVAFSCHYNIPAFYRELADRSPVRMMKAVGITMPMIFSLYLISGLAGVLQFGGDRILHKSQGDILNDFTEDDVPMNVGRLIMFLHFVCVYPIVCIACRRSVNMLIFERPVMTHKVHIIEALLLVAASCTLAYLIPDVSVVFSVNGAAFGLSIVVILPNVFYLRVIPAPGAAAVERAERLVDMAPVTTSSHGGRKSSAAAHPSETGVEMCDLSTADPDAFHGNTSEPPTEAAPSSERTKRIAAWLQAHTEEQTVVMRRASFVLVTFGAILSVVSLVVTIVKVAG